MKDTSIIINAMNGNFFIMPISEKIINYPIINYTTSILSRS
jgi:hypothetical protein